LNDDADEWKSVLSLGPFLLVFHGISAMEEEKAICVASGRGKFAVLCGFPRLEGEILDVCSSDGGRMEGKTKIIGFGQAMGFSLGYGDMGRRNGDVLVWGSPSSTPCLGRTTLP
jgi:hypothetical protein